MSVRKIPHVTRYMVTISRQKVLIGSIVVKRGSPQEFWAVVDLEDYAKLDEMRRVAQAVADACGSQQARLLAERRRREFEERQKQLFLPLAGVDPPAPPDDKDGHPF